MPGPSFQMHENNTYNEIAETNQGRSCESHELERLLLPSRGFSIRHRIDARLTPGQALCRDTLLSRVFSFSEPPTSLLVVVLEAAWIRGHIPCELCSTCLTKQATLVVRNASDRRQPNDRWLLTPLTVTASRCRIHRNSTAKLVFNHRGFPPLPSAASSIHVYACESPVFLAASTRTRESSLALSPCALWHVQPLAR